MVPRLRALISSPEVNSGTSRSCWIMAGIMTIGVTNSMPNTVVIPIPRMKLRSRNRRKSMKGRSAVKLCTRKIQPNTSVAANSRMISTESNQSSRSPRSAWLDAGDADGRLKPVQSSLGRAPRGGSGLMNANTPTSAMTAIGIRMKKTQRQEISSLT